VCAAVLIYLERTQEAFEAAGVRFPDDENRTTSDVDVLAETNAGYYVLEHTLIQTYPRQVLDGLQFVELLGPLEDELQGILPVGDFTLSVGICGVQGAKDTTRIRTLVADWVKEQAPALALEPPGNRVVGRPDGVPFDVALMRHLGHVNRLKVMRSADLDTLRMPLAECLETAMTRKLPKLAAAGEKVGGKSVFVMESADHLKDHCDLIAALEEVEGTQIKAPDLMFFVETQSGEAWFVRPVNRSKQGFVPGEAVVVTRDEANEFLERVCDAAR
jgi:hypothetical protein